MEWSQRTINECYLDERVRALEAGHALTEERLRKLETNHAIVDERTGTIKQDVKEIKSTLRWLNRLVLGVVIVALLNLIIISGG